MTPDQRADAVVESFCEKSPLPKNDAIALRSSIAQVLKVVADEKDKEKFPDLLKTVQIETKEQKFTEEEAFKVEIKSSTNVKQIISVGSEIVAFIF